MHQLRPVSWQEKWRERFTRSGYFFGALLLHLVIFLMIATIVIWHAPTLPVDDSFQRVSTAKIILPPPPPPSAGESARNTQFEPQQLVVPVSTPDQAITTPNNSSFNVNASKVMEQALSNIKMPDPQGAGMTQGGGDHGLGAGTASVFGTVAGTPNQLEGYLYDLKQTADRKPTGITPEEYHKVLMKFVQHHWDANILAAYYKSPKPLYTSAILIPIMNANLGPKAFGLENEVQPSRWIIWYKGKVSPPTPDHYRFAGMCDDVLLVRLDGRMVLDGSLSPVENKKYDQPWKPNAQTNKRPMHLGEEFAFSPSESKDIDIIIGEEPGGVFYASLFALKKGETYPNDKGGLPELPLFQIGTDYKLPEGKYPSVNPTVEPWQGSSR